MLIYICRFFRFKVLVVSLLIFSGIEIFSEETFLRDLTLEQAELIAVTNNNTVNSVRELYLKAKAGRIEAMSKWLPKLHALSKVYGLQKYQPGAGSVSAQDVELLNQAGVVTRIAAGSAFETQLALTQSILSTNDYYNIMISSLVVKQLELLLNAALIDVLYQTRVSYYQVVLDLELIKAAKDKVELLKTLSKQIQDKHQIGTALLYHVNQSKVAVVNATNVYYDLIKQKKIDSDNLANILGYIPGDVELTFSQSQLPVDQIEDLKDKITLMQKVFNEQMPTLNELIFKEDFAQTEQRVMSKLYSTAEIHGWEDLAMKYTPSLKVYENYVQIASKEFSKAKATYLPEVDFNVNFGSNPSTMQGLPARSFGNQNMNWGAGIKFNWLVFDSYGREARIKQARFDKRSKEFNYRQEKQNTFFEVRKRIFEIEESVANYMTAQANMILAEQTVSFAKDQLDTGYGTIFDCQITLDGLVQAKNDTYKAKYQLLKAYYGLRKASGIDLEEK
jgi:outer membrane protein TolC